MNVNIIIKNGSGLKVYDEIIVAENCAKALEEVLKNEEIYLGDTIIIKE